MKPPSVYSLSLGTLLHPSNIGVFPHHHGRNWTVAEWIAARCWPPSSFSVALSLIYSPPPFVLFYNLLDLWSLCSIASQSEWLQWHTKEIVIRLWHLSHSACHSSPGNYQRQQAHPMCCREACRDGGRKRGEKGVGGVKRGIRGIILLSVIIANL